MGAANARLLCETKVFISQHNFSDHGLCFPTVYHVKEDITLKAGADVRGLRFGVWKEGWTNQHMFEAENGSKWRILEDTVEEWNNALRMWIKQEPYKKNTVSKKSQLAGKCFPFCDKGLKVIVKLGEKFDEMGLTEVHEWNKDMDRHNEITRYNEKRYWEQARSHREFQNRAWQSNFNHRRTMDQINRRSYYRY